MTTNKRVAFPKQKMVVDREESTVSLLWRTLKGTAWWVSHTLWYAAKFKIKEYIRRAKLWMAELSEH